MPIILTDKSADEFYASLPKRSVANLRKARFNPLARASYKSTSEFAALELLSIEAPYDLLVFHDSSHRASKKYNHHQCQVPLPAGSFFQINQNVFVCSPELTFVRMASFLTLSELIALGYEYCGTYSINPNSGFAEYDLEPLTTAKNIASFVKKCSKIRGIKKARIAAQFIADSSASPMETALHMTLCLPGRMGGYNLPFAKLNHAIPLNEKAQKIYHHRYCRCDLFFEEASLDLEYHGASSHENTFQQDSARAYALEIMGCRSLSISGNQFNDINALNEIARKIATLHGRYIRNESIKWTPSRNKLRQCLRLYFSCENRKKN